MRNFLCSIVTIACVLAAPVTAAYAQALDPQNLNAEELARYDAAMVGCMEQMRRSDWETAIRQFDGIGFAWTQERDDLMEDCMREAGFAMPGSRSERVGTPNMSDPRPISAAEQRRRFEQGILEYGGPEVLDALDGLATERRSTIPPVVPPDMSGPESAESAGAAPSVPQPSLPVATETSEISPSATPAENPDAAPSTQRRQIYVTPDSEGRGAAPIWLDIQR